MKDYSGFFNAMHELLSYLRECKNVDQDGVICCADSYFNGRICVDEVEGTLSDADKKARFMSNNPEMFVTKEECSPASLFEEGCVDMDLLRMKVQGAKVHGLCLKIIVEVLKLSDIDDAKVDKCMSCRMHQSDSCDGCKYSLIYPGTEDHWEAMHD